ncbi:MAG: allophanate hydrolase [Lutibacter sp.]|nr:MAG: allophanate hydrolase [Lutibacter sp.]
MIKVIHAGLLTSVQDKGRIGFRKYGVPLSGVMDAISASFANALLNNKQSDAVIEITMVGPKLLFTANTIISLAGADISPKLNGIEISNYKAYKVSIGAVLSFGKLKKGARVYLAVKGGLKTEKILNSRSNYIGITSTPFLTKNEDLKYNEFDSKIITIGKMNQKNSFFETTILEVFKGPEFEIFSSSQMDKLLSVSMTIATNNRMGYRLKEHVLPHKNSIITSPVLPGTVQLIPSGQLIILMKDAQTTGGYPRVFQLTEKSIAILAQKKAGDTIQLKLFV